MATKTLNISIPIQMAEFLDENTSLHPSAIFQSAVENIQNSIKHNPQLMQAIKELELSRKKNEKLAILLQQATKFIEDHNLWEKFLSIATGFT